jgi:hypothetical protein
MMAFAGLWDAWKDPRERSVAAELHRYYYRRERAGGPSCLVPAFDGLDRG